jgi:hypothetical protein
MINPNTNVFIFVRKQDRDPFIYLGNGQAEAVIDEVPVKVVWKFTDENKFHPEHIAEEIIEPEKYFEGVLKNITVNKY